MASRLKNIFVVYILSFYLICSVPVVSPFIGIAAIGATVFGGASFIYTYARCSFSECCDEKSIMLNVTGLTNDLSSQLHGQHLVSDTVIRLVRGHANNPNPAKALVLSFHGWTGSGKNFVTKIIAQNLFANGLKSRFVNMFIAPIHFPHVDHSDKYKENLQLWIRGNVSSCGKALFIFDEMDKMPVKVLDAIAPYIDHHEEIDGVDYRKTIFLFLSNSGGNVINAKVLDQFEKGLHREDLTLKVMEDIVMKSAFGDEGGGFWHANMIDRNLISAFVPFLPMERRHVELCIRDDLHRKNRMATDKIVSKIADLLEYFPQNTSLFSRTGCKRVSQKVDLVLDDDPV